MTGASCCAAARKFNRAVAEADRKRYGRSGPDVTTRAIIELIRCAGGHGATLLDIGSGIGVIAHELLAAGAVRSAVLVEGAPAYIEAARAEAEQRGTAARLEFVCGDVVDVAGDLPQAEIVTLDRVVCCYQNYDALVRTAVAKCRRALALSYPRDRWYVRAFIAVQNLVRRISGEEFRLFIHSPEALRSILVDEGFKRVDHRRTRVWAVDLFVVERSTEARDGVSTT